MTLRAATSSGQWTFFRAVFWVAAAYDVGLGAAFFLLYAPIFDALDIPLPNNTSYIHLTAAFVFVQGIGYWFVAQNMARNVDLVRVGIIYKAMYTGVAIYYLARDELIHAVFAWFAVFDAVFLVLFVAFLLMVRPLASQRSRER